MSNTTAKEPGCPYREYSVDNWVGILRTAQCRCLSFIKIVFCTSFFHWSDQRNAFRNAVFGWRNGRGLHDGRWWFHERQWWWFHEQRWRILLVFVFLFLLQENCHFVFSYPIERFMIFSFKSKKQLDTLRRVFLLYLTLH